ncbi:MAG TPA: hypothetical protein VLA21_01855 [Candidatus Limnocylindria bacterium]|nr:hypothetical protein [Candidatus Limnocylindria bacterium]
MKRSSAAVLGVLVLLAFAAASLAYGAYKGYGAEKARVESALTSLDATYSARVETGNNILTVARRHAASDHPLLAAVRDEVTALSASGPRPQKAQANARLEESARALLKELEALPSVRQDARDYAYVTGLLPQALDQSAQWADAAKYNEAAAAFNQRLTGTLAGRLARLLGISEAAVMSAAGRP